MHLESHNLALCLMIHHRYNVYSLAHNELIAAMILGRDGYILSTTDNHLFFTIQLISNIMIDMISVFPKRILGDLWWQVTSHSNLHIHDFIVSSLRSDEFWHFRPVLLYERSHTAIQLNAQ